MCGIFGWDIKNKKIKNYQKIIMSTALMCENDHRGGHSWGYWSPDWDNKEAKKGLGKISIGARATDLSKLDRVMAHTRYATTGKITIKNSHPFVCGDIIGAHNGCVSNFKELNELYHHRKCKVDSQHIFWHLWEEEPLDCIEAYGSIEFSYLNKPDSIYLAYFNGGDLAVADIGDGTVWSSSATSLKIALRMAKIKFKMYKLEEDYLYYTINGILYHTKYYLGIGAYHSLVTWDSYKNTKNDSTYMEIE